MSLLCCSEAERREKFREQKLINGARVDVHGSWNSEAENCWKLLKESGGGFNPPPRCCACWDSRTLLFQRCSVRGNGTFFGWQSESKICCKWHRWELRESFLLLIVAKIVFAGKDSLPKQWRIRFDGLEVTRGVLSKPFQAGRGDAYVIWM